MLRLLLLLHLQWLLLVLLVLLLLPVLQLQLRLQPADAKQATTDEGALREDSFLRPKASVVNALNIHRDNLRRSILQ